MTTERIIIVAAVMAAVVCLSLLRAGWKMGIQKAQGNVIGKTTPAAAESSYGVSFAAPALLDRSEFSQPEAAWLLAVFAAKNCRSCAEVWQQLQPLASETVAVCEISQKNCSTATASKRCPQPSWPTQLEKQGAVT